MAVEVRHFAGTKFWQGAGGYFRSSRSELMHRVVYSNTYGNIPHGWQVHHRDGDPANNDIENLVCCPASEHQRMPKKPRSLGTLELICAWCVEVYETIDKGGRHKFCSGRCKQAFYARARRLA
jgi:hypothetical protein